jgi:hypothetical protein
MPNDEGQQANETSQGGNSGQQSATTDFEGLYSDEVKNAQRLRQRAQEAEAKIIEFEAAQERIRQAELEAKGEFDTVKAELESKLQTAAEKAEAWDAYQTDRRKALEDKLSDDDKKFTASMDLQTLELFVDKATTSTTGNTPGGAGTRQRGGEVVDKPWTQMTAAERQAYLAAANQRK